MTPPPGATGMDRRAFLRTVAVSGAALTGLLAVGSPAAARMRGEAARFDPALPGGQWHYPAAQDLLPFGHGVASGDPLADRVVLWTRITIPDARGWDTRRVPDPQGFEEVTVGYVVATDPALQDVVAGGTVTTDATRDFTVKVDPLLPASATTYWYAFTALGYRSPVGRTRTAPAVGDGVTELTIGHVACTNWWADLFNGYARIGERGDVDLLTHAGDHVYEVSGNHMGSRFFPDPDGAPQVQPYDDIDNRTWRDVGEVRRRYALYYHGPNMLVAHAGVPWAIMADQHDYDDSEGDYDGDGEIDPFAERVTRRQAGEVLFEWSPIRPPRPDGSGEFMTPDEQTDEAGQVRVPRGDDAFFSYRSLDFGDVAQIVLVDQRRHRDPDAATMQLLGDDQWAWLQRVLVAARDRGARHNVLVTQLNVSQLGTFNTPAYSQYRDAFEEAFGLDPRGPERYTTGFGGVPEDRRTLYGFLRDEGILDNVVLSGDSHGWFGSDLTEDPQLPNYVPLTGLSPLQPVGVEMVGTSMGRPGAQDVVADELYWQANGGRQAAPFDDAATYDQVFRPLGLAPAVAIETAARLANPNLIYFNWRAEYGHTMVHLRPDEAIVENWVSPQRELAGPESAELVAQHTSPRGNPHLVPALQPAAVVGSRQDPLGDPATVELAGAGAGAPGTDGDDDPAPAPAVPSGSRLPATGGGGLVAGAALLAGAAALRRRSADPASQEGRTAEREQADGHEAPAGGGQTG